MFKNLLLLCSVILIMTSAGYAKEVGGINMPESLGFFRSGNDNFRIQFYKFIIILAQLRHVRAAEWSKKSAVKNHHHIFFVFIV